MGYEVGGFLGFLVLLLNIWAIVKVANSHASGMMKFVWIAAILILPVFGVIVWYLFGPKG